MGARQTRKSRPVPEDAGRQCGWDGRQPTTGWRPSSNCSQDAFSDARTRGLCGQFQTSCDFMAKVANSPGLPGWLEAKTGYSCEERG